MVRAWTAVDRPLWIVAVVYALLVIAPRSPPLAILREQSGALHKRPAVLARRLKVGTLAEANRARRHQPSPRLDLRPAHVRGSRVLLDLETACLTTDAK